MRLHIPLLLLPAGGTGVRDADFILYVAANDVGYCRQVLTLLVPLLIPIS